MFSDEFLLFVRVYPRAYFASTPFGIGHQVEAELPRGYFLCVAFQMSWWLVPLFQTEYCDWGVGGVGTAGPRKEACCRCLREHGSTSQEMGRY